MLDEEYHSLSSNRFKHPKQSINILSLGEQQKKHHDQCLPEMGGLFSIRKFIDLIDYIKPLKEEKNK